MLVSDPTLPGFNSYASRDEALVLLSARLNVTDWATATETNQNRALIQASDTLDVYCTWYGLVYETDQVMGWPRSTVQIEDRAPGVYFPKEDIPLFLKVATSELAVTLLGSDITADQEGGLSALSVGPISLNFDKTDRKAVLPSHIQAIVDFYASEITSTNSPVVKLVRV